MCRKTEELEKETERIKSISMEEQLQTNSPAAPSHGVHINSLIDKVSPESTHNFGWTLGYGDETSVFRAEKNANICNLF